MYREIPREELEKSPYSRWNAFIDLIATEEYSKLSGIQQKAHLIFWYESEMQNGGIIQYFTNHGVKNLDNLIEALRFFDAESYISQLERVTNAFVEIGLNEFKNKYDFVMRVMVEYGYLFEDSRKEAKLDKIISSAENDFYDENPSLNDILKKCLNEYENEFIKIV